MVNGLALGLGMLLGGAQAASPAQNWTRGGWHASATTPGETHDVYGYALGMAHRGKRGSVDLDLSRELYPLGDVSEQVRIDAQGRTRMAGGFLIDGREDELHHVELQLDRTAWLDLQQSLDQSGFDHRVAHSGGLSVRYGRISSPDCDLRTSFYVGAGLQRAFSLDTAHDGDEVVQGSSSSSENSSWDELRMPDDSDELGRQLPSLPSLPSLNLGRHRVAGARGVSLSAQARLETSLWSEQIDGRIDSSLELSQLESGVLVVGDSFGGSASRQTTVRSQTRLSARYVGWESLVVPTLFLDINTLTWLESPTRVPIQPVLGVGLTRGGA